MYAIRAKSSLKLGQIKQTAWCLFFALPWNGMEMWTNKVKQTALCLYFEFEFTFTLMRKIGSQFRAEYLKQVLKWLRKKPTTFMESYELGKQLCWIQNGKDKTTLMAVKSRLILWWPGNRFWSGYVTNKKSSALGNEWQELCIEICRLSFELKFCPKWTI